MMATKRRKAPTKSEKNSKRSQMYIKLFVPSKYEEMTPDFQKHVLQFMTIKYGMNFSDAMVLSVFAENKLLPTQSDRMRNLTASRRRQLIYSIAERLKWTKWEDRPFYVPVIGNGRKMCKMWFDTMKLGKWIELTNTYSRLLDLNVRQKELMQQNKGDEVSAVKKEQKEVAISLVKLLCPTLPVKEYERWHFCLVAHLIGRNEDRYAKLFPDLFKPLPDTERVKVEDIKRIINNQYDIIRALTDGDVTRNEAVLNTPIYDCFLELNRRKIEEKEAKRKK